MLVQRMLKNSSRRIYGEPERPVLGILAFEISRMMSKVVNIWHFVNSRQIARLRDDIANSIGIRKLVSEDDDYLMDLALAEIIENLVSVGKSVAMLGKKCTDATYHNLETIFDDPSSVDPKWYGWQYRLKKMDRKIKKMEKFLAATEQLHSELQILEDLEQTYKQMQAGANSGKIQLFEFQQRVLWQRQEVKSLQEMSPWVRTYDYIVRLLLRSLFTIIERIKFAFGSKQIDYVDGCDFLDQNHADYLSRCNSMSGYSSESNCSRARLVKNRRAYEHQMKGRIFPGCIAGGSVSPLVENYRFVREIPTSLSLRHPSGSSFRSYGGSRTTSSFFNLKRGMLNARPSTLGYAALSLHYANVIILIEKLVSSPHLISLDARDDLYDMLPSSVRSCMRTKVKTLSRMSAAEAGEWSSAIAGILEWLSPLARNMIRWQSERNFERQRVVCGSNILLVQTLYFANRADTEEAIVELLMGLTCLLRFGKDVKQKSFREYPCSRVYDDVFYQKSSMYYYD